MKRSQSLRPLDNLIVNLRINFEFPKASESQKLANEAHTRIHFISSDDMSKSERDTELAMRRKNVIDKNCCNLMEVAELVALYFYDDELALKILKQNILLGAIEKSVSKADAQQRLENKAHKYMKENFPEFHSKEFSWDLLSREKIDELIDSSGSDALSFRVCEIMSAHAIHGLYNCSVSNDNINLIVLSGFGAEVLLGNYKRPKLTSGGERTERDKLIIKSMKIVESETNIPISRNKDNPQDNICKSIADLWLEFGKYIQLEPLSEQTVRGIWGRRNK